MAVNFLALVFEGGTRRSHGAVGILMNAGSWVMAWRPYRSLYTREDSGVIIGT